MKRKNLALLAYFLIPASDVLAQGVVDAVAKAVKGFIVDLLSIALLACIASFIFLIALAILNKAFGVSFRVPMYFIAAALVLAVIGVIWWSPTLLKAVGVQWTSDVADVLESSLKAAWSNIISKLKG